MDQSSVWTRRLLMVAAIAAAVVGFIAVDRVDGGADDDVANTGRYGFLAEFETVSTELDIDARVTATATCPAFEVDRAALSAQAKQRVKSAVATSHDMLANAMTDLDRALGQSDASVVAMVRVDERRVKSADAKSASDRPPVAESAASAKSCVYRLDQLPGVTFTLRTTAKKGG